MAEIQQDNGFSFNNTLGQLLNAYSQVTLARVDADKARYTSAAAQQLDTLHAPTGAGTWAQSRPTNPNAVIPSQGIPPALVYGGLVLGAGFLLLKVLRK